MTWYRDIAMAFMLLSRFPVPAVATDAYRGGGNLVWAFPIVGAVIGVAAACGHYVAFYLGGSGLVAGLVALATAVMCSGAMHEDGLADFFDGMGGMDKERRLTIMRDSRVGTFGVVALFFVLGLQTLLLAGLLTGSGGDASNWLVIVAVFALSRGSMAVPMVVLPCARADGLGESVSRVSPGAVLVCVLLCVTISIGSLGIAGGAAALVGAALGSGLTAFFAWRMLGGQTGDVLGASCCFGFLGALVALSVTHKYPAIFGA